MATRRRAVRASWWRPDGLGPSLVWASRQSPTPSILYIPSKQLDAVAGERRHAEHLRPPFEGGRQQPDPLRRQAERPRLRELERRLQELAPDPGHAPAHDDRLGVEDVDVVGEPDPERVRRL